MELAGCWKRAPVLLFMAHLVTAFLAPVNIPRSVGPRRQQQSTYATRSGNEDTPPSWRYEVDDLIKAVSPWGSLVEAEIIGTDLGDYLGGRRLSIVNFNTGLFTNDLHTTHLIIVLLLSCDSPLMVYKPNNCRRLLATF